jgi:putative aldouronate transport system permease protein
MQYRSVPYSIFSVINNIGLAFLALICIAPIIHTLAVSFSSAWAASGNLVRFWPVGFTTESYAQTLGNNNFLRALWMGLFRTALGAIIAMATMSFAAYALSKEENDFRGRTFYMWFFVFTMLMSAGMVPNFILIQKLHLMNTIWALVLPGAVGTFNLILLLNFFRVNVPKALMEAAYIDGADHFTTLIKVYLPIAVPVIATVSLFVMVGNWNAWFDGMIYMTNPRNYPMSTFLYTVVIQGDVSQLNLDFEDVAVLSNRTLKASQVFLGMLPILLVYPFLQRYFVTGIVMGSVKE